MDFIEQSFSVRFDYKVFFTRKLFALGNATLKAFMEEKKPEGVEQKLLVVLDEGVSDCHPGLAGEIESYMRRANAAKVAAVITVKGGEGVKNDGKALEQVLDAVHTYGIDRHSYLMAIGGGAVLDMAGYAAAIAHRGIRHIRVPTTVLSQNDSGVGVKNGVNFYRKKNFLGTFAPPVAVFNDSHFLTTLSQTDWRSGMSEAVKVALIKDKAFFEWIEENTGRLTAREMEPMEYLVKRCAALHMEHIAGGDPFETGSSRPLDFGHWSAHKLEALTGFTIRHGEAVAIGIALDSIYSMLSGRLGEQDMERIIQVLRQLGFRLFHPALLASDREPLPDGLGEFREHLGGRLTIMLLKGIGMGEEVHEMDEALIRQSGYRLETIDKEIMEMMG